MHFLIVKSSALGDILHAFPVIAYLRQKFPDAKIDWVVETPFAELVHNHPDIHRVFLINTKIWRKNLRNAWSEILDFRRDIQKTNYDIAFDFQGNIKSGLILSCVNAKEKVGFGKKTVQEWPNLFFTTVKKNPPKGMNIREDNLFLAQSYFGDPHQLVASDISLGEAPQELIDSFPDAPYKVMVCPGAFWPNKQLSLEGFSQLLQKMASGKQASDKQVHFFFAWGTTHEHELTQQLAKNLPATILPRLKLPALQNVMGRMDLVIAMDSLPLHLAATTKTATLSFFGPSLGKKYAPIGPQHQVIQGMCPYQITFTKRCPHLRTCKTGACLKNLNAISTDSPPKL